MLYYTHINEDNRAEQQLLQSSACTSAIAVAGSGERVLALMGVSHCKRIMAVDINKEALFLLELKLAAIIHLTNAEYFRFTGHHKASAGMRRIIFEQLKSQLSPGCADYWEQHKKIIIKGILDAGHFEKFLARTRPMLSFFLGKKFQQVFEQLTFNAKSFPGIKWKLLSWMFSQKWIYQLSGNKDIAFIGNGAYTGRIPTALTEIIQNGDAPSCYIAHLIFKGHLRDMHENDLPPSLQNKFLDIIRKRIISGEITIDYYEADLLDMISEQRPRITGPVFVSASDILSFEDSNYLDKLIGAALQNPGDTIAWRSFLRNKLSQTELKTIADSYGKIEQHSEQESTRMYQVFSITANNT